MNAVTCHSQKCQAYEITSLYAIEAGKHQLVNQCKPALQAQPTRIDTPRDSCYTLVQTTCNQPI
jgi:hypothetical protein